MDLRAVPFKSYHYEWLAQDNPTADGGMFTPTSGLLSQLEGQNSWTGVADGAPIVCGGTYVNWPGRHSAWVYLGRNTGRYMKWITKNSLANLANVKGRIELSVRADFEIGMKWAEMLGFKMETPLLKQYGPLGEDHVGFVRIN